MSRWSEQQAARAQKRAGRQVPAKTAGTPQKHSCEAVGADLLTERALYYTPRAIVDEIKRATAVTLDMPYPCSTNNCYMTIGRRRVLTPAARAYHNAAGWIAQPHFAKPLTGPVAVSIEYWPKRGKGLDLGNCEKVCLDSLKGIAWVDDSQIRRLELVKHEAVPNGKFLVTIEVIE